MSSPDPRTQDLPQSKLRSGYLANGDDIHPPINNGMAAKSGIDMAEDGTLRGAGLDADRAALKTQLLAGGGFEVIITQGIPAFSLESYATALCGAMPCLDQMLCPRTKFCLHGL
jgi:hypothetical protein